MSHSTNIRATCLTSPNVAAYAESITHSNPFYADPSTNGGYRLVKPIIFQDMSFSNKNNQGMAHPPFLMGCRGTDTVLFFFPPAGGPPRAIQGIFSRTSDLIGLQPRWHDRCYRANRV